MTVTATWDGTASLRHTGYNRAVWKSITNSMFLYLFKTIMKIEEKIKATDTTENLPPAKTGMQRQRGGHGLLCGWHSWTGGGEGAS